MNQQSTGSDTIVQEITISASADRVFDAFANAEERLEWWGRTGRFHTTRVESDLRAGGRWMMWFETPHGPASVGGEYRAIDIQEKNGVTHVRLTHSGLIGDAERNNTGWPALLTALRAHLERDPNR